MGRQTESTVDPEAVLFEIEAARARADVAAALAEAAAQIEGGSVDLSDDGQTESVTIPEEPTLEVELERVTDSETGGGYNELEYEITWPV